MKLTHYYRIYNFLKTGRRRFWVIRSARALGFRYMVIRLDTNFLCNLRCPSCFFTKEGVEQEFLPPMKLKLYEKIARELFPRARMLFLSCGGEPLMSKNFDKYIDMAAPYNIPYIGFTTNGLLLNEKVIQSCIRNRVNEITFSADGATAQTYERLKAGGKFEQLLEKLELTGTVKQSAKVNFPEIRFNYTLCADNVEEMLPFLDLAAKFNARVVKFRHFMEWGGKLDFASKSLAYHREKFNRLHPLAKKRGKELGMEIILPAPFSLISPRETAGSQTSEIKTAQYGCIYPWFTIFVRANGEHRPCNYLPWEGDFTRESYREYLNRQSVKQRMYLIGKKPQDSCMFYVCKGNVLGSVHYDSDLLNPHALT